MIQAHTKRILLLLLFFSALMQASAQWNRIYNVPLQMRGISFPDKDTGYICGAYEGPKLMKSTTGGYTWEDITGSFSAQIYSVHFITPSRGVLYCSDPYNPGIYKTTDGGSTWSFIYFSPPYIWSFSFVSPTVGYAFPGVMEYAYCAKTTDGGDTWTQISSLTTTGLGLGIWDSHFPNATRGYFVTDEGSVYKSTNAGVNWTRVYHTDSYSLRGVFFTSPDTGYVAGADNDCLGSNCGVLLKTVNAGTSWQTTYFQSECYDVIFTGSDTGYMSSGGILKTTNRGVTWTLDTSNYYYCSPKFDFPMRNIGYGIGGDGSVMKHGPDVNVSSRSLPEPQELRIFPVPANGPVSISFDAATASEVTIDLLNSQGVRLEQIYHGFPGAGHHTVGASLEGVASGIYYCRLVSVETVTVKKIVVCR